MQDSAREIRLSLGRPSSHATLEEALQQVEMLKTACTQFLSPVCNIEVLTESKDPSGYTKTMKRREPMLAKGWG